MIYLPEKKCNPRKPWRKSLREYSNKELLEFLDNNENEDLQELAAYCSEVLRRFFRSGFVMPVEEK